MPLIGQRAEAYLRPFRIISFTFCRSASMSGSAEALSSVLTSSRCSTGYRDRHFTTGLRVVVRRVITTRGE